METIELRDNGPRGRVVKQLILILLVLIPVGMWFTYLQMGVYENILAGTATGAEKEGSELRVMVIGLVTAVVNLSLIIYFIQWFRRAYFNLHMLGHPLMFSEGWAAGGWFVPLANFFIPFRIMREIWMYTQLTYAGSAEGKSYVKGDVLLVLWWLAFWGRFFLNRNAGLNPFTEKTTEEMVTVSRNTLLSSGLDFLALLFLLAVVYRVTRFERNMQYYFENQGEGDDEAENAESFTA